MKVKELIIELGKVDPNAEVILSVDADSPYRTVRSVEEMDNKWFDENIVVDQTFTYDEWMENFGSQKVVLIYQRDKVF
jgi:hypothetical protein